MRVFLILIISLLLSQIAVGQTTYTVTSSSDESDFDLEDNIFDPPTLRSAIENANKDSGLDIIRFSGIDRVKLLITLPAIAYPIDIDGKLNSGEQIVIDGKGIVTHTSQGLIFGINADNSTVKRLTVINFLLGGILVAGDNIALDSLSVGTEDVKNPNPNGDPFTFQTTPAIYIRGDFNSVENSLISGNNGYGIRFNPFSDTMNVSIQNNIIGLDSAGIKAIGNLGHGILITNGSYFIDDNIITGNGESGIVIEGISGSKYESYISANRIGINKTGNSLGNNNYGIEILADSAEITFNSISGNNSGILVGGTFSNIENNIIGKERASDINSGNANYGILFASDFNNVSNNTISGNGSSGIYLISNDNYVSKNIIGLNIDGDSVISNSGHGIEIEANSVGNEIIENTVSGNAKEGIYLKGNNETTIIRKNLIGTDISGTAGLANQSNGILIVNGSRIEIGGDDPDDGNVISSNNLHGIYAFLSSLRPDTLDQLILSNNYIGVNKNGDQALGNGLSGISFENYESLISENIISGNNGSGLVVSGRKNKIEVNYIGTDVSGINTLENGAHGIELRADSNFVGDAIDEESGNLISGNRFSGILVFSFSEYNTFAYNFIGLDINGEFSLANGHNGISFGSGTKQHKIINNVISGNEQQGIRLFKNNTAFTIIGNIIGADVTGQFEISNLGSGIHITDGDDIEIGLPEFGSENLISGNQEYGVQIMGQYADPKPSGITIKNNTIGAQLDGFDPLKNYKGGIVLYNTRKVNIGGEYQSFDGNIIAGNDTVGIYIIDDMENSLFESDTIIVKGNLIGLNGTLQPLPNNGFGLYIENYELGGLIELGGFTVADKNIIAYNSLTGMTIEGPRPVNINVNEFYSNGDLAIDLNNDGVSLNVNVDKEQSANYGINYPIIGSAFYNEVDEKLTVYSSVIDVPFSDTYFLDYFYNESCDDSGYGEAQFYLETIPLFIDESGVVDDSAIISLPSLDIDRLDGIYITATHSSKFAGTSELSKCFYLPLDGSLNASDLVLTKTDSLEVLSAENDSAVWKYEILVKNISSVPATNVIIVDTLDQNLAIRDSLVSISKGTFSINENVVTGNISELMPGDSVSLTIPVETSISTEYINIAYVSMLEDDLSLNNNMDSDTTEVLIETNDELEASAPEEFSLFQNYPNPFNPSTTINYSVPEIAVVEIKIFNSVGILVATLVNEVKSPGYYSEVWDASNFASGLYIYKMNAGSITSSKKMLLIK